MSEKGRNRLLALLSIAHSFNHSLFLIAPPLLLIIMNDLKTSQFALGIVGTASSFIYGIGSLVGGPLSDKINEVKIVTICLALAGASTLILVFANNVLIYGFALILMATWASLYHPTANSLISKVFHGHMAEAMGFHGVGGTLGVMFTPIAAFVLGITFGWQFSFLFFGGLSVVVSLFFFRSKFKQEKVKSQSSIRGVFKTPGLWKLFVFNIVLGLYMKGLELFLPAYLALKPFQVLDKGSAEFWAAVSATLVLASGVPGQWLGGKSADAFGSKKVLVATSVGVLAGLIFLQFTPFWFIGVPVFIVLYGLSFYGHQPALNSLAGIMTPEDRRGMVYGMLFFTSFGLGSISSSITGYLMEHSIDLSFYVLTVFAVGALLLSLIIPDIRENNES
ncbi:MAG: MFS transporter [Candidatus Bathyarchaeota archaeon]|nr:MAG: MFS transporter [Candidatus Bathyarchaeota archaeon]